MKQPLQGVFVTGTDTGVGKTFVAAGLLAALRRAGMDACPMKPVQTGCTGPAAALRAPDLDECLAAGALACTPQEYAWMAPYRFRPACSPHLAAKRAQVRIRIASLLAAARHLAGSREFVVVEGAGGVLVPLNDRESMGDLMRAFGLPVLLVARAGLGTINHTLLSLQALRCAGLKVGGVVVTQAAPGPWGRIEADNVATLERWGCVPVLGVFRHCRRPDTAASRRAFDALARRIATLTGGG